MNSRFRVIGRLDAASRIQEGTVTISRSNGIFSVRPLRRHREYSLPLSTVAELVCRSIIRAEVLERKAKKRHQKRTERRMVWVGPKAGRAR